MKLRSLVATSRGLAAAAVIALALGIGMTALMFAIIDGAVRRGLPVPDAASVVHLARIPAPGDERRSTFTIAERRAFDGSSLSAIAAYRGTQTNIAGTGVSPRRWEAALVSLNTFEVLGASAAIGAVFSPSMAATIEGATPLIVSHDVWREQFGSDPSAAGRVVRADGNPAVIVGIMPRGFRFPTSHHVWMPLDERNAASAVQVWGRLASGVSEREAEAELTARYQQAAKESGAAPAAASARVAVAPFTRHLQAQVEPLLETMFLAGLGLLAIACANAANLLLARGLARSRDFAIAGALGATRSRIMRERLVEGLALAVPGAALGIALTYAGAAVFTRAITASVLPPPYWVSIAVDHRVLAYVVMITLITALAAAALPAWRSGSAALSSALREEGRTTTSGTLRRTTAVLVIVEITLAAGVLVAAGLMGKGILRLARADYGFAIADVTVGRLSLPQPAYRDAARRRAFYTRLHAGLQSLPGVRGAALGSTIPFAAAQLVPFTLDPSNQDTSTWLQARRVMVSPGYFDALSAAMIGGRDFEPADREGRAPVAIVNLSFALKFARREDLIGRTITIAAPAPVAATIIGIAPDLSVGNPRGEQPEAIYVPLFQPAAVPDSISVVARADRVDGAFDRELRAAVAAVDPDVPLDRVMTLEAFRHGVTWFYRVFGLLFLAFGLGALILALVGVYAVMSYAVTRRRREIGTRMALGATGGDIARMFLLEGSRRMAVGLAAGALLAAWLTPRLSQFLFQVSPRDPAIFAAAIAVVAIVGLSACAVPAWRAARQDPNVSLRDQ